MDKVEKINTFLQFVVRLRGQDTVAAVAAARWLDAVGLLEDSATKPGKPLRDMDRNGRFCRSFPTQPIVPGDGLLSRPCVARCDRLLT